MTTEEVSVRDREIVCGERSFSVPFPVHDALLVDGTVIVLYDPDCSAGGSGQFHNLVAFDDEGNPRWTAELPTTLTGDRYLRLSSREPLRALSFHSYECTVDTATGKIDEKIFLK